MTRLGEALPGPAPQSHSLCICARRLQPAAMLRQAAFASRFARFLRRPFVSGPFLMRRFAAFAGNLALLGAIIDANPRSALDTFSPPRRASCSSGGHARQRQRLKQTDDHDDGADDHVVQGRGEQRAIPKHERRNDLGSLASAPASVTEVHASQERRAHINMMNSSSDDENGEAAAIFSASSRMIHLAHHRIRSNESYSVLFAACAPSLGLGAAQCARNRLMNVAIWLIRTSPRSPRDPR